MSKTMCTDAAQQAQFAFARVLAALPGLSTAVSGQPAFSPSSQSLR
jgi:hypothetical protein